LSILSKAVTGVCCVDNFAVKEWYLWPCQSFSGAVNMQLDHFLARQLGKLLDRPVLRFFTWDPHCISLGFHQTSSDINQELCFANSLDVVRRPTGGRAILHAEELTYSIIYPFDNLNIVDFYRLVHIPFITALQEWQIPAEFQPSQADFRSVYKTDRAFLCFATSAKYEVEIQGKKLIGSAQRIYENSILQHGSILLGPAHEELVNLLNISPQQRTKMQQYVQNHTTFLWKFDPKITAEALALKLKDHFKNDFNLNFIPITENKVLFRALKDQARESEFAIFDRLKNRLSASGIQRAS
jgi:lipoyl(octanoyl) transferase